MAMNGKTASANVGILALKMIILYYIECVE